MAPRFIRNLVPKRDAKADDRRPFLVALKSVTLVQWGMFFSGWLAWTCDAIDFFSVSLSIEGLEAQFHKNAKAITTAITLTLLFRSVGAVIFGVISDRYGRKWPLVANLILVGVLQLGAGFVNTFRQFLAVRSLFGIGMGGIWGMAASTALENLPVELRGIGSGILQQGYAVGYLLAACIQLRLVPAVPAGWRALFWTASGISFFAAFLRALFPESQIFIRAKEKEAQLGITSAQKSKAFLHSVKHMLKQHWLLCIYAVLLMTGFNFLSHGSQDLYPTYLKETKGFSGLLATKATIIGNCGAISGGAFAGFLSQYIGRRLTIIIFVCWVAVFIPLWILPSSFSGLSAGAFWIQFGVQGAWGVIPIQLAEISPPAFRATFPGVAYQLGNMVSSASAQIEATGGEHIRTIVKGKDSPDYATVQGILIGCVAAFILVVTIFGPESHSSHFEEKETAVEEGVLGDGDEKGIARSVNSQLEGSPREEFEKSEVLEKAEVTTKETV
ncbi:major facilitator superfamily domain-containing protein [Flagelloscypha sp. PMI_526]|nr:major facilitator superfamily domain-containing protein [Flagelloscypha sp. PMI_526]